MRLHIVSTCLWKIWWPTWCHMFNIKHWNDFVTQKVSRHRSFSVWTRAWTRLVHTAWKTCRSSPNIGNYGTSCIHTRPLMRKFACGHFHVSQKVAQRDFFHSEYTSQSFAWVKPMTSDMISYVKSCIHTRPPMWKFAPGDVLVSQNNAEKRLLVKNCTLSRLTVDTTCRDTSH